MKRRLGGGPRLRTRRKVAIAQFATLVFLALTSRALAGQQITIPDSGMRVRVSTAAGWMAGELVRLSADSIVLNPGTANPLRAWPRASVNRFEVSRGRHGHFLLGLLTGTVVGLGTGIAVGKAIEDNDRITAGVAASGIWLGGTVVGGVVGAVVRTERWAPAAWPPTPDVAR